ncbi:MAG TPA: PKD domain-containing protein, partial [Acidimicrobiia bacterium]|nr:PKD domain-containing protein [Acidimicrobiia bacterium]
PDTLLLPDNPSDSDDPIGSLIVAHGLRNPYRMTVRPGTNEIYIADVGYNTWEEINRILDPTAGVLNFGWPCYEGPVPQDGYAWFGMCQDLISGDYGPVTAPFFAYRHNRDIQHPEDDDCPPAETGQMSRTSSSTTGLAFYTGSSYPSQYDGALFGADYSRGCIWVMRAGADGRPNPSTVSVFHFEPTVQGAEGITPVDLETGPDGRIYGVSIMKGHIFRFNWTGANDAPTAVIDAEESEDNELEWILDGTRSIDPENKELTYAWDLDNDGLFDDETDGVVSRQFTPGPHRIGLRVTDIDGASSSTSIVIQVANTVPQATIHTPSSSFRWAVGETISYSGSGFDDEDGTIPGSQMHWAVILHHCGDDGSCHEHHVRSTVGESGSLSAPEHEYPSWLELRLTVEDSWGPDSSSTASVRLDPKTVQISVKSEPEGINVGAGTTPFSDTVIVGSRISLAAPTTVERCGRTLQFSHWSNGGTRIQEIPAPATPTTYTAVYNPSTACDGIGLVDVTTGEWHLRDPRTQLTTSFYFGNPGDYPFMGDWDCDGVATPGLYRQSDGFVYLRNSNTQGVADITFFFGNPGDVPIAGDFNGDGCDTVSIYRPSEQRFYIINKLGKNGGGLGAAEFSYIFGNPGDKPFVGDFDGDGKDTIGLHRESTGLVYFRNTHTQGVADAQFI